MKINPAVMGGLAGMPYDVQIERGLINGAFVIHKFGRNFDIDGTDVPIDIWSYGGGGDNYVYPTSAAANYISSSNNGDAQDITIEGLDANWDLQTVTQTLAGQTKTEVGTSKTWIRTLRAWNAGSTNLLGDVYVYENDTPSGGVPPTASKVKAKIDLAHQQTLMALYTIPAGHTAYLSQVWVNGNRGDLIAATAAKFALQQRSPGGVFRTMVTMGWHNYGGAYQEIYSSREGIPEKTDLKVICDGVSADGLDAGAGFDLTVLPNQ